MYLHQGLAGRSEGLITVEVTLSTVVLSKSRHYMEN